jgi:hypothetical protein
MAAKAAVRRGATDGARTVLPASQRRSLAVSEALASPLTAAVSNPGGSADERVVRCSKRKPAQQAQIKSIRQH